MKESQQLFFFYLKSHAWFVPFISVLFPLDFSPTFYGLHKRATAKFSNIASSQETGNVYRVEARPVQEHTWHPKLKESPLHMQLQSYDPSGITETWGECVHD